ncbi:GUN4 domain-containing protein [Leptolyngbya sp. AN02str]|uniref:GUN4 domain-containing protein n=1 Tax=Leptolyngbya sp. AN02str TaxID=3423363 RepID=UPI003D312372
MPDEPSNLVPTTLEKVFELLDSKLVTFGVPGALSAVGIAKVTRSEWTEAGWCFAVAAAVWLVIKTGKKLAPKIDQLLDWGIGAVERSLLNGWSAITSDITKDYLEKQARLCEEFISEGFNPDRTAIPLLEQVFVPLDLSGAVSSGALKPNRSNRQLLLPSPNLSIWDLLKRSESDRQFRQMCILAKGGMGKTTLLRHVTLIYGQRKQRRYRAPAYIPVLLRLRDWVEELSQAQPPSLLALITNCHIPSLSKNHPLTAPPRWAEQLLVNGEALVMFDGFDEIPEAKRTHVSQWLSAQMQEYPRSVFILTSRPAGYKDYAAQKPAIPIYVNKFTLEQQAQFIHRWYLCQEQCCRSPKQYRIAKRVAAERATSLIDQLNQRRGELGYMAENPLLLNMLVTYHRFDPTQELPQQRLGLYRGICKLQLEDRPKARGIQMLLPFAKSNALLQSLALKMLRTNQLTISQQALLTFVEQHPLVQDEEIDPADWLKQIVDVSELLVEREPKEYEFPHASFQGFFAATQLAQVEDKITLQKNAGLILQHWNGAIWRETVLLYTAQLPPKLLAPVIQKACDMGSEAADLATLCLQEYPRPDKLSDDLLAMLQSLEITAQRSKYQTLEALLKVQQWKEADEETYRLMITAVGKEEGQWFEREELLNFPCEDLLAIDGLWIKYSNGLFGFSVQKQIYVDCGATLDGEYPGDKIWGEFCDRVGWREDGNYLSYSALNPSLSSSRGSLPFLWVFVVVGVWVGGVEVVGVGSRNGGVVVVSSLSSRLVNCSR